MDTLLRNAVEAGSVEDIVVAVQRGANVNARDDGGETALTLATHAELGPDSAKACVRCLLGLGARVSEERPHGGLGTSLHGAAAYGFREALKDLLLADGRVSLNTFDDMSRTPLICAVQNARLAEASLLLEAGADVNANDTEKIGNTALSYAVENWDLPMVQLLLKHDADPTIQGWMQLSALDRVRDWESGSAAPERRQIFELINEEAKRRTPQTKRP
jgi:ankyrin repeat protein